MSYAVIIPILYSTTNSLGGLEFSSQRIGIIMGAFSFFNALIQVGFFKRILKKIGPRRMFQISYTSMIIPFAMLMCEQMLVSRYGKVTAGVYIAIAFQLAFATMTNTAYSELFHPVYGSVVPF